MPPSKASSIFSTSANGTKTQEQALDNRGKVEEILDEEVLPDATNTPQIESDDSSSMESVGVSFYTLGCYKPVT